MCNSCRDERTIKHVNRAIITHGDLYDYSLIEHIQNVNDKAKIICKIHGVFEQSFFNHIAGFGCKQCGVLKCSESNKWFNTDEFRIRSSKVHNNFYNYDKSVFIDCKTKVTITCPSHGEFLQKPYSHMSGCGCPQCGKLKEGQTPWLTKEDFIERASLKHNNYYSYNKSIITRSVDKTIITCPVHGDFEQKVNNHLTGAGCLKCKLEKQSSIQRKTIDSFIEESNLIHNNFYDYSKFVYHTNRSKSIIICPIHGEYEQQALAHIQGHGCQACKASRGELKIKFILDTKSILYKIDHRFKDCRDKLPLPFDFYIPSLNCCIEYDGRQHFEEIGFFNLGGGLSGVQRRDSIKNNYCLKNGIRLIRIRYDEDIDTRLKEEGIIL